MNHSRPPRRRGDRHPCARDPSESFVEPESYEATGVRPELAPRSEKRHARASRSERDADRPPGERLGDVPPVREDELENASTSQAAHPQPADGDPTHHAAGCPHDDHDPDPHPDRDARAANGTRRQEHERVVVARLCAAGEPRRDGQQTVAAGREDEPCGSDREPTDRRPANPPRRDARTPVEVEREPRAGDIDHDGMRSRVRDPHGRTIRAGKREIRGRRGERERGPRGSDPRPRRGGYERRSDQQKHDEASHAPITVNVTVVV